MKLIVLLLILLSSTFILSRMSLLRQIQGLLVVPMMIGAGVLLGPKGLFPLDEALISSLDGTMRMVLVWMGFLAGLRATERDAQYRWSRQGLLKLHHIAFSTMVIFLGAHFLFALTESWGTLPTLGISLCLASLFVTSSYFSSTLLKLETTLTYVSYADSIFLIFSFFAALFLLQPHDSAINALLHVLVPVLVSLVAILLIGKKEALETPDRLALGGVAALAGGWAMGISLLEVIVGFFLGALITLVRFVPRHDVRLLSTEVPLRMALYFYAGLIVELSWDAFFIALVFTVIRFVAKWWLVQRHGSRSERLSSVYRFSTLSIPLLLSLVLSPIDSALIPLMLAIMCFAYLINDILLVIELSLFHAGGSEKTPSDKVPQS